jgi:hypothetical protein
MRGIDTVIAEVTKGAAKALKAFFSGLGCSVIG